MKAILIRDVSPDLEEAVTDFKDLHNVKTNTEAVERMVIMHDELTGKLERAWEQASTFKAQYESLVELVSSLLRYKQALDIIRTQMDEFVNDQKGGTDENS